MKSVVAGLLLTFCMITSLQAKVIDAHPPSEVPLSEPSAQQSDSVPQDVYILVFLAPDGTPLFARIVFAPKSAYRAIFRNVQYGPGLYNGYFAYGMGIDPMGLQRTSRREYDINFNSGGDTVLAAQFKFDWNIFPATSDTPCLPYVVSIDKTLGFDGLWDWDRLRRSPLHGILIPSAYLLMNLQGVNSGEILGQLGLGFINRIIQVSASFLRVKDRLVHRHIDSSYTTEGCPEGMGRYTVTARFIYQAKADGGNLGLRLFAWDVVNVTLSEGPWEYIGHTDVVLEGPCCCRGGTTPPPSGN